MECNKEEAIRAKEIAEQKMQIKDFVGARKLALKAQQLFSDLDNISQILTVCEVHCCAGLKVNGEMDWYGILQVEQTADESSIRKQYRKLALLLHPDKNKFSGAEAAFKLVGEAHMTLADRAKRSIYDTKRRANIPRVVPKPPAQQSNMTAFVRKQPAFQNNFSGSTTFHYGNTNQQQTPGSQTFWTMCPQCCMKFQYFRNLLNRSIRCHRCLTSYVTSELDEQAIPRPWDNSANLRDPSLNSKLEVPVQANHSGNSSRTGFQGNVGNSGSGVNMAQAAGGSTHKQKEDGVTGGGNRATKDGKPEKVNTGKADNKEHTVKPSAVNVRRRKGRKRVVESSDSDSGTDSEDVVSEDGFNWEEQNAGTSNGRYPRRSCRMKQNITYAEGGIEDDDDFVSPPKRLRKAGASHTANHDGKFPGASCGIPNNANDDRREDASGESLPNGGKSLKRNKMSETEKVCEEKEGTGLHANPGVDSKCKVSPDIRSFSTPDAEFYNFERERNASKVAVGQIWAVYDELDAMPRFYVLIRAISSPFELHFRWLEHNSVSEVEEAWKNEELPVACGNYRLGRFESRNGLEMFSHIICWAKGEERKSYNIYPRKGEIWALFKGWDLGWSSDANSHRLYEYEVVEVLSDLLDGSDFRVVRLVKVQGFVSLFVRTTAVSGKFQIPPAEVLRFSHRVPSYRTSGDEREGVPEGCFELDTASLPIEFGKVFPSISLEALDTASVKDCKLGPDNSAVDCRSRTGEENSTSSVDKTTMKPEGENGMEHKGSNNVYSKGVNGLFHNANANSAGCSVYPSVSPLSRKSYEYLETEFHDFQEDRSIEKFQQGQIWALYSEIDEQPKYYGKINKVDVKGAVVKLSWLELFPQKKDEVAWKKKHMPAACGRFKVVHKRASFDTTGAFSHLVHAKASGTRGDQYDIYPRIGEVWALYEDWNVGWKPSTLRECKYDVVEILEVGDSVVKVLLLTRVDDYNAVFMPQKKGDVEHLMEISLEENLRFSHQIPAFRLTSELGGALQGYWELDSAALCGT